MNRPAGGWQARAAVRLALGALAAACGPGREAGGPVPEYAATALAGDSVALAELRGEVVLLNVWATWCAPCRVEIPALQDLHQARAGEGLHVVGVSVDDASARDDVRSYAAELGVTYDIWLDPAERVAATFLLHGIPSTILIDRAGRERWRHVGPIERDDAALRRALDRALAERATR